MTASEGRPLIYLSSAKSSKEQTALSVLKDNPITEGLICTLSVVECCQTLQPLKHEKGMLFLANVNRKCKYYYFYYLDKNFGFMHVKLQIWFPFLIQVYIIGSPVSFAVIDWDNADEYVGIGTRFNPETNELTLYDEIQLN